LRLVTAQLEGGGPLAGLAPPPGTAVEAGYRALTSIAEDAILVVDAALRIRSVNDAFIALLGYPDHSALVGRSALSLLAESDRVRAARLVARFFEIHVWDIAELDAQRRDGTVVKVEAHCKLLQHEDGGFAGMLVLLRDIGHRHLGEDPLRLIVEATSRATGGAYFASLVQHLAETFRVRMAIVAELTDERATTARTLAFWMDDGLAENLTYALEGTPCEGVCAGSVCYIAEGVQGEYPQDAWLREVHAESYLGAPLTDSTGKVIGLVSVMDTAPLYRSRDVSSILAVFAVRAAAELERMRIEAALTASEERLAAAVSGSKDGLFDANLVTGEVYCSPRLYEIAGYAGYEAELDLSGDGLLSHLHKGDADDTRAILLQCIAEGRPYHHSFRWRTRSGEYRWCEARLDARSDASGVPIRLSGFVSDVTDLRREARLAHETGNLTLIGGWELDLLSGELHWTAGTFQLHAVTPATYVPTVETAIAFYTPESQPVIRRLVERAIATGAPWDQVLQLDTATGERLWVRVLGRVEWDGSRPVRLFGAIQDVSAQRQLEQELLQSQKLEGIGRLAGGIAHDFNNLLTAILGYAELGMGALPRENPVRADLEQIKRAGVHAAELTSQLLAFAGRQRVSPRAVNLPQLVEEVLPLLRRLAGDRVTISVDCAPETWPVTVDPGPLEQVIVNLVINARDAMPGGGTITIATRNRDARALPRLEGQEVPPTDAVEVSVTDTGVGIVPDVLPLIFEPFFTTKPRGKGTGLGLATCHGLIHQAGGLIWATSGGVGLGATMHCLLPRAIEAPSTPAAASDPIAPRGTETILLLEDEGSIRELAARVLRSIGYQVLEASSAREALALAEAPEHPIDLVVSDVVLPELSGPEVLRVLRERVPGLRGILVSGYADQALVSEDALPPRTAFLPKPYSPAALAALVREILDTPHPQG